jgi:hypothetical protein
MSVDETNPVLADLPASVERPLDRSARLCRENPGPAFSLPLGRSPLVVDLRRVPDDEALGDEENPSLGIPASAHASTYPETTNLSVK